MHCFDAYPPASFTRRTLLKFPLLGWAATHWMGRALAATAAPAASRAHSMSLNGTWSLTYGACPDAPRNLPQTAPPASWPTIQATVPGNVELDLVAAGRIEPLERGSRVYEALDLESHQWWFRRSFHADAARPGEKAELVFDGLDCLATVWLNGTLVGKPANMLIPHRFDVTALLKAREENEILVRIDPAVPAGLAAPRSAWEVSFDGHWESLPIRKAPHMYGWDIMPRVVSAGMWRGVRIEWTPPVQFASVYWFTRAVDVEKGTAVVEVNWEIAGAAAEQKGRRVEVELRRNGRTVFSAHSDALSAGRQECALDRAELWWPRGYGEQPLYEATVTLRGSGGEIVDWRVTQLGIRTIELKYSDIVTKEKPGAFGFAVNGVAVFVKGVDWSPMDALHSRDPEHLEQVFPMLAELNCNMVRCWGGNVYESDRFFDLCDEAGVMVWQDFAMACAEYPQDEAFLKAIAAEVEAVVPRLRNHPSMALWSGNNEVDDALVSHSMAKEPVDPNRDRISREVIPAALQRLDPHRSYLPSSPYHSPAVFAAGNGGDLMPEVHLWGPRGYFKAPFYTESPAHFVSEIGYHGCPSRSSLKKMFDAESVYPWTQDAAAEAAQAGAHDAMAGRTWNDEWLTKSVRFRPDDRSTRGRNNLMLKQIKAFFGTAPEDLDEFILASQITQAEAMKFFVDFWRQQKGPRQGIIWWNLRDGWPILSDAVVDYYNNRKLAFQYIQHAQRNVQAICCEAVDGQHAVVVVNDTLRAVEGRVEIRKAGSTAKLLEKAFRVEANGKARVGALAHPAEDELWLLDWSVEGAGAHGSHYLAVTAPIKLAQYKEWMKELGVSSPV
jgi:beta-mannosidase